MALFKHAQGAHNAAGYATCSCGWVSNKASNNQRKSWRQHVTRGTQA